MATLPFTRFIRLAACSKYASSISIPRYLRPVSNVAAQELPLPTKGSNTTSRGNVKLRMSGASAATGNDVKVVQELMRHSKISRTMEVYAQAGMEKKRAAQRKAVDLLLDRKPKTATADR